MHLTSIDSQIKWPRAELATWFEVKEQLNIKDIAPFWWIISGLLHPTVMSQCTSHSTLLHHSGFNNKDCHFRLVNISTHLPVRASLYHNHFIISKKWVGAWCIWHFFHEKFTLNVWLFFAFFNVFVYFLHFVPNAFYDFLFLFFSFLFTFFLGMFCIGASKTWLRASRIFFNTCPTRQVKKKKTLSEPWSLKQCRFNH